jgi:HEAT repeat protein
VVYQIRSLRHPIPLQNLFVQKKRVLLLCLITAGLALGLFFVRRPSNEPSYNGHPLSFWVSGLVNFDNPEHSACPQAIDHIGVAALPFLLKWIKYEQPAWRRSLGIRILHSRLPGSRALAFHVVEPTSFQLGLGSGEAFGILGERASPAFDGLCRILNQTNAPQTSSRTALTLAVFGTKAIPPLMLVATNAHHPARACALQALDRISVNDDAARLEITALTNCVGAANPPLVRKLALMTLARFKAAPEISIPGLMSMLTDANPIVRRDAVERLGDLGTQARVALPALTNALSDTDPSVRRLAIHALQQIAPEAQTNAPAH